MIKITPATMGELQFVLDLLKDDKIGDLFAPHGYQVISPETGRPVAGGGGGPANTTHFAGTVPTMAAGGSGGTGETSCT